MTDLKTWIKDNGYSQARLARKANVSPETMRLAIEGQLVRPKVAEAISDATDGQVTALSMMKASSLADDSNESAPASS
jgi:lambda repressor-like predicted transcriptional regulator